MFLATSAHTKVHPLRMSSGSPFAVVESILARLTAASASSLENGALKPMQTEQSVIPEGSTKPGFSLRLLQKTYKPSAPPASAWKGEAQNSAKSSTNPFLPYDKRLYVGDIPPAHVLLLNKFPVIQNHALLVTRKFEPQSSLLTFDDHLALWDVFSQLNALAFYNAGPIAGASQPHKHLQIIPMPLVESPFQSDTPFDRFLELQNSDSDKHDTHYSVKSFPFLHAVTSTSDVTRLAEHGKVNEAAGLSMRKYTSLMSVLEPRVLAYRATRNHDHAETTDRNSGDHEDSKTNNTDDTDDVGIRPFSYNLIVTRSYMLVVPRRKEKFQNISVNALGFVGCLLVKDDQALNTVKNVGPMRILSTVALPDDTRSPNLD